MAIHVITMTLEDDKGRIGRFVVNYRADSIAETTAYAQSLISAVNLCIGGAWAGASITVPLALPAGVRLTPHVTSDTEQKDSLTFRCAGNTRSSLSIPTWSKERSVAIVTTQDRILDLLDDDVFAVVQHFTGASLINADWQNPTDARGAQIESVSRNRYVYRRPKRR